MSKDANWEEKVWGDTNCVFSNKRWSIHELNTLAGGFCSVHYHTHRLNIFRVKEGALKVVWCYAWQMHSAWLTAGKTFSIRAGIPHQFQSIKDCKVIEEYTPDPLDSEVSLSDIERLTTGGMLRHPEDFLDGTSFFDQQGERILCWKNAP